MPERIVSGSITDPPAGMPEPTYFLGICDTCRSVNSFGTAKARDLWQKHHPHQEDPS